MLPLAEQVRIREKSLGILHADYRADSAEAHDLREESQETLTGSGSPGPDGRVAAGVLLSPVLRCLRSLQQVAKL